MKLADAYTAETGAVGNSANIGCIAPGTKKGGSTEACETTVFDYTNPFVGANGKIQWSMQSPVL